MLYPVVMGQVPFLFRLTVRVMAGVGMEEEAPAAQVKQPVVRAIKAPVRRLVSAERAFIH